VKTNKENMDHKNVNPDGMEDRQQHETTARANVIPVIEEHLHIGTSLVETGRVHVSKKVIEEPYDANVSVLREEVTVETKAVNQFIEGEAPGTRQEGSTTIIPVLKEVLVKRLFLVEEIHITRHRSEDTVPVHERLRREEVSIERSAENGITDTSNYTNI
jgi:uncharacterized protein (TIGR02271 family)